MICTNSIRLVAAASLAAALSAPVAFAGDQNSAYDYDGNLIENGVVGAGNGAHGGLQLAGFDGGWTCDVYDDAGNVKDPDVCDRGGLIQVAFVPTTRAHNDSPYDAAGNLVDIEGNPSLNE